jgi:SPP1 gp7 family putative phage head morphogenesis protein
MVADIARRNLRAWNETSKDMGRALRRELKSAPTGALLQQLMDESVDLITTLPLTAAQQVHEIVLANLTVGVRASALIPQIIDLGSQSEVAARRIARTETARCAASLTQARAEYVGSEGYIWRTAGDSDVRESHKEMEGKYVRWDTVPKLSDGTQTHAGMIYNCRCFAEPVLPES